MSAADALSHPRTARGAVRASARLLGSEMRLILGRRRNRAGVLVLAAVPILIAVAIRISGPGDSGEGPTLISAVTSNGIFVALTAMSVEMALFLPLAVAVLSGDTIAGEANLGTLRYLLTVPVDRTRLLLVKYVSLVIGALIGVAVVAGTGLVVGGALLGLGPTTLLSGNQISLADALVRLAVAVLYLTAGLAGLAAVGLFVSTLTEQPIAAMIATTVVATAMWILDAIPQLDWLGPWLLVHRWSAFADADLVIEDDPYCDKDDDGEPTGIALPYVVTLIKGTNTILSIRRNWREDDKLKLKRMHFVHYQYIPGFGAYGFGLFHLIWRIRKECNVSHATVGRCRHSQQSPPGDLNHADFRIKGDDTPIAPGEWRDVDVASGNIRDSILPLPYKDARVFDADFNRLHPDSGEYNRWPAHGTLPRPATISGWLLINPWSETSTQQG